ncbi:MAG: efflux RND transporter periplasmic adaptor subunit, partial [Comamonas sp.]|nr:efflux RND transporter periplasmic adaptor subunit [Comamonas sp.]
MKPVLKSRRPVGAACLLLCLALAACNGDKQPPAAADSQTALRREGNLVVVPPQSPVLAQLKLAQVSQ